MTAVDRPDDDLFAALTAINVIGPDSDGLLWVSFTSANDGSGALSVRAESVVGRAVTRWREMQTAALAKAVLVRASRAVK